MCLYLHNKFRLARQVYAFLLIRIDCECCAKPSANVYLIKINQLKCVRAAATLMIVLTTNRYDDKYLSYIYTYMCRARAVLAKIELSEHAFV